MVLMLMQPFPRSPSNALEACDWMLEKFPNDCELQMSKLRILQTMEDETAVGTLIDQRKSTCQAVRCTA